MRLLLAVLMMVVLAPVASAAPAIPPTAKCEFIPTPENPAARPVQPPPAVVPARGTVKVTIVTNYGVVAADLDRANAPCGVANFAHLARSWFYTMTQCWRLTDTTRLGVLQCGDIYRAEEGGPGYRFADEVTGKETYPRGTIAYGNQGPGTNGSEFFIVHSFANIRPVYTVMGHVTFGMDTLDRIVKAGIVPQPDGTLDGAPKKPVRILHVLAH
ncbi:peptidylprolyl isomerase [Lentzea aerocolonigenes]|uniref:peptidylprolyl isomerase n=1 Tax=Lentzea aerocolonigenes TaxID=68170 RepID=UPI00055A5172|nr:peptidylprolyl isomerase [Lentzea aerocolonigenes]MCP2243728.1 peptidyl-prolyl cis-trans isomerase B (cyclophilin B) [Lentzea aerocolonigenes]